MRVLADERAGEVGAASDEVPDGARRWRRVVVAAGAVVLLFVSVVAVGNRDLIWAYLTHRVGEPSQTWEVMALPVEAQPELRVALVGDVGDGGGREYETARAIEAQSAWDRYDILMLLGDNVYPSGDPDRIRATVFEPFGPLLDGGTELFAALGNHDTMEGIVDAQLEALGMPDRWYSVRRGDMLDIAPDSTDPSPRRPPRSAHPPLRPIGLGGRLLGRHATRDNGPMDSR